MSVVFRLLVAVILLIDTFTVIVAQEEPTETCSWNDVSCYQDPNLKEIQIDLGTGSNQSFWAYVPPDVSTFYRQQPLSRKPVPPKFNGQFGKFINMSPTTVTVFWTSNGKDSADNVYISDIPPFQASATATFPGHIFLVKLKADHSTNLHRWTVSKNQVLYAYDPIKLGTLKITELTSADLIAYNVQNDNLKFAQQYKAATGIDYLSLYPLRPRPSNPMWPAEYFGQEHSVVSGETHFQTLPPPELLKELVPKARKEVVLKEYRDPNSNFINMTLQVLSCSPRVFEIQNFLSKVEIDHIMQLATGMPLHQSSTKAGNAGDGRLDTTTRSSRNTWVRRGTSPIIDAIYRRAADLMQMDEAYIRVREQHEMTHLTSSKASNGEELQLVHYNVGQQYTPHHDFAIPDSVPGQPMRFATILFYLNEGMKGGETTFPRWLNAESSDELKVVPEIGKAILFYSLLPDGNMDERSQHSAAPVTEGEKWLINLWTWDPVMRR